MTHKSIVIRGTLRHFLETAPLIPQLNLTAATTLRDQLNLTAATTLRDQLNLTAATTLRDQLNLTAATTLRDQLNLTAATTLRDQLNLTAATTLRDQLNLTAATTLRDQLNLTAATTPPLNATHDFNSFAATTYDYTAAITLASLYLAKSRLYNPFYIKDCWRIMYDARATITRMRDNNLSRSDASYGGAWSSSI